MRVETNWATDGRVVLTKWRVVCERGADVLSPLSLILLSYPNGRADARKNAPFS